jgi:hypothetical protein
MTPRALEDLLHEGLKTVLPPKFSSDFTHHSNLEQAMNRFLPLVGNIGPDWESCVQFSCENLCFDDITAWQAKFRPHIGFKTLDTGFTYLSVLIGGDGENPLAAIIYYDGATLRGYVPKNGNVYNFAEATAFGAEPYMGDDDDEDRQADFIKSHWASLPSIAQASPDLYAGDLIDMLPFDWDLMKEDIAGAITIK